MTVVAVLLAVALIVTVTGAWYERHQTELDRRAERSQWASAMLAKTSSEFMEAQRQVDPHLVATGARERMARRRREAVDEDEPQIPIGL